MWKICKQEFDTEKLHIEYEFDLYSKYETLDSSS